MLVPRGKRRPDLGVGEAIIAMIRCGRVERGALMNRRTRAINRLPGRDLGCGSWAGTSTPSMCRSATRPAHATGYGSRTNWTRTVATGLTWPTAWSLGQRHPDQVGGRRSDAVVRYATSCVGPGGRRGNACNMNCVPWQGVVIYGRRGSAQADSKSAIADRQHRQPDSTAASDQVYEADGGSGCLRNFGRSSTPRTRPAESAPCLWEQLPKVYLDFNGDDLGFDRGALFRSANANSSTGSLTLHRCAGAPVAAAPLSLLCVLDVDRGLLEVRSVAQDLSSKGCAWAEGRAPGGSEYGDELPGERRSKETEETTTPFRSRPWRARAEIDQHDSLAMIRSPVEHSHANSI